MAAYQCKRQIVSFPGALILAACIVLLSVAFSILLSGEARTAASDLLAVLVDLLAAVGFIWAAQRSALCGRHVVLAWMVLTLGLLTHTVGDILWTYSEVALHQAPFPSLADGWFLAQYPLFALGILLLPRVSLTRGEKLLVLLDMGMVMIASAMIFWILLIAPIIESSAGADLYTMTLAVAYPVMDLLLLFALIELLFRRIESLRPGPILLLAFATAVMIGTDFIVFGQTLQNTYDSGGLLDTGWIVAYLSFGLAGVLHANSPRIDLSIQGLKISNMQFSWVHLLPYISAAAAYVLLLWSYNNPLPLNFSYLSWGVGGIIGLIIIRQIAALRENESLYLEAKSAGEEVRRLNEQLEARVIERTKQLESANIKLQDEIRDRKRIEEDLRRAKDAAEVATNAKSQFLAVMSHELRTPMNAVIGLTGLLLRTDMTWEQRDYVQTIQSSGNALLSIINDVLDYSKIDNGKMELEIRPFDLKSCIEEARDLLASNAAEKSLTISYVMDDGIPEMIMGDPARLRQILVNLLGNAVKFTSAGRIEIAITSKNIEDKLYEIHFAVKDTGIGIPQDKMSHLFQSFSQVDASTSRRYGGTGLGLAISKRIVELMGGRIWAESEAGIGSAFHFTIPAKESSLKPVQSIKPAQRSDTNTNDCRKNSLRILLAEDNMINQKVMLKMLNKLNYRADVAANGLEALAALESQPYDVVLMDIQMPEMDGWEAAKKIREKWPKWPKIFAVTAYAIQGDRERCLAAGMDDYITKPVKIEELQAVLESTADLEDSH